MGKKTRSGKKSGRSGLIPRSFRELAFVLLRDYVQRGRFLSDTLNEQIRLHQFDRTTIRQAQELAFGTIRRLGTLKYLLEKNLSRPWEDVEPELQILLQLGVYQILFMDSVPDHAAVHETVELSKRLEKKRWVRFLNGILRNITRMISKDESTVASKSSLPLNNDQYIKFNSDLLPDPVNDPVGYFSVAYSFPRWLSEKWFERFSQEELFPIGEWFNSVHPLSLRINSLKITRDDYLELLSENGLKGSAGEKSESVILNSSCPVQDLPGFSEGFFMVQDQTAMQASFLLAPAEGEKVLDLCAAPGTKTGHLVELMNDKGSVVACDVNQFRLNQIEQNIKRFGYSTIQPEIIQKNGEDIPSGPFDAILVDAPCSNTGVMGKRPEARWRINISDINELVEIQKNLIMKASDRLSQDGRMVYSTCSIEPEENQELIKWFLEEKPEFTLVRDEHFIPGFPDDGGYQALIKRKK